jgi:anti-sigma28 factor (negative regulator of flagellin synthesis)
MDRGTPKVTSRPSKRDARIAELRSRINSGTYHVDARELSKKIVDAHIVRKRTPR